MPGSRGIDSTQSIAQHTMEVMGTAKSGVHKQKRGMRYMGQEPTREFTPSMDYRHLLSPDTLAALIEHESKQDARTERDAEIAKYTANGGQSCRGRDKARALPRTDDLPGDPLSEDQAGV